MKLLRGCCLALVLVFVMVPSVSAAWADRFEAPKAIGPGTAVPPGATGVGLAPELTFKGVGSINEVFVYEVGRDPATLEEMVSGKIAPQFTARLSGEASAVRIPDGVLQAGKTYSWYVRSVHNPGTRSEAVKKSEILYFKTAATADAFYLEYTGSGERCESDFPLDGFRIRDAGKNRIQISGCLVGGGCITSETMAIKSVEKLDDGSARVTLLMTLDGQPCKGIFTRSVDAALVVPLPGTYQIRMLVNELFYQRGERLWAERTVRVE